MSLFAGEHLSTIKPRSFSLIRTAETDFNRLIDTLSQLSCSSFETKLIVEILNRVMALRDCLVLCEARAGSPSQAPGTAKISLPLSSEPVRREGTRPDSWADYRREGILAIKLAEQLALSLKKIQAHSRSHEGSAPVPPAIEQINQSIGSAVDALVSGWNDDLL